jgi:hypothetical protein
VYEFPGQLWIRPLPSDTNGSIPHAQLLPPAAPPRLDRYQREVEVPVQPDRPTTRGEIDFLEVVEIDFLEAVAEIFRVRGDGDLAIPDISGVLESYECSIERLVSVGSSLRTWINIVCGFGKWTSCSSPCTHGSGPWQICSRKLQQQTRNLAVPNALIRDWPGTSGAQRALAPPFCKQGVRGSSPLGSTIFPCQRHFRYPN